MENLKVIEFHRTRDFSQKMNATFEFVRQNSIPLLKSLLFIAGPPVLLASFFISSFYGKVFNLSQTISRNPESASSGLEETFGSSTLWIEIGGAVLFAFLAVVFTITVVNNYMKEYEEKKTNKIDVNDVWTRVRETMPMYLGTMFLYAMALVLTYLAALIPVFVFASVSPIIAFFGFVFVFCFLFYIWVALSMLFVVRAYENTGFIKSVSRSFYLVRGKFWSTFGIIFVTSLISGTVSSVFFIPWYINMLITMLHSTQGKTFEEPSTISQIIYNGFLLLYFLSSFILHALPLIGIAFQYFNLVERKEAKGLMSRIDTLGQQTPSNPRDEQY